jgi:Mn2+/Fe2+ NRAMP family transporter
VCYIGTHIGFDIIFTVKRKIVVVFSGFVRILVLFFFQTLELWITRLCDCILLCANVVVGDVWTCDVLQS